MTRREKNETTTYTAIGPVRGGCGHEHRTIETAARCLERDRRACTPAGYSDRLIFARTADHRAAGRAYLTAAGQPSGKYGHHPRNCRALTDAEHDELRDAQDDALWGAL